METIKELSSIILDLLRIIAWPLVAIILICIFRKPIINLIDRIREIGVGDKFIRVDKQQVVNNLTAQLTCDIKDISEETNRVLEEAIKNDIDYNNIPDNERIIRLLFKAKLYLSFFRFEWINNLIFGTQIQLIEYLNTTRNASKDSLQRFYDYGKIEFPSVYLSYDYNSYLGFLISSGLISSSDNDNLMITSFGQDFLKFLIVAKKDKNKPF